MKTRRGERAVTGIRAGDYRQGERTATGIDYRRRARTVTGINYRHKKLSAPYILTLIYKFDSITMYYLLLVE